MSNLIANFFQNLGDPDKRVEIMREAFGTTKGAPSTSPPARGLRGFANALGNETYSLGVQAGMDVKPLPTVEGGNASAAPGRTKMSYTNPRDVFRATLAEGGLPEHAIEGIMMNGQDESAFNPRAIGDNGAAGGILQWNGPRFRALKDFAASQGADWHDPRVQAQFTLHELQTSERAAYDALMQTSSPGEAGAAFVNLFERPAEQHRRRREAEYLGYRTGTPIEYASGGLSYGAEVDAVDPMTEEYIGRSAEQPLSMGMDSEQFNIADTLYGKRQAMEILNNTQDPNTDYPVYADAILRFLEEEDQQEATPAEQQASALAMQGIDPNAGAGLSMGYQSPDGGSAGSPSSGGAAAVPPSVAAPATKSASEEEPKLTAVDRLLNTLYGTDVDDMSDDERADRRRAVGIALSQGFQMLSRGTPMDVQGIVQQRMDLQAARRASADLKNNAQAVSDMLAVSGMPELANLPFAGEAGMNAAMQALVTRSTQTSGSGDTFDLPPGVRATAAQTLADMGHAGLAEQMMTLPAGKALEDLYGSFLGTATTPPKGGEDGPMYTQEQRTALEQQFRSAGNTFVADAIVNGLDDKTLSKMVEEQGKVAPAVQQAGGVAQVQAGVGEAVETQDVNQYADGLEVAGYDPTIVEAVRASGSTDVGKTIVEKHNADKQKAVEDAQLRARGEAVAQLVPDDMKNAEQLREAARNARTSEDLRPIYEEIAGQTPEEKLYQLAKEDPNFVPFLTDLVRYRAGMERKLTFGERKVVGEIDKVAETMANSRLAASRQQVDTETIRQILVNPDFNPGKLQGTFVIPMQQWLTSIAGDAAPQLASDMDLVGARVFETMAAQTFVAASEGLKGAISDKETAAFMKTATVTTDEKVVALAQLQYRDKIVDIQQAEYNAMLEWAEIAEKNGTLGDRQAMLDYVNKKVGDMKVFEQVNAEDVEEWLETADLEIGEVFEVVNPDSSSFLIAYGVD